MNAPEKIDEDAKIDRYIEQNFDVKAAKAKAKPEPDTEDAKLDRYVAEHFPGRVPEKP